MADTEKNEDQKISRCLQEAFGYTDEQLLKQLDQANETLKDVTFDGAEDRIMKKIMARKAELEKETSAPEPETERNITLVKAEPEERKDKKIVRFGKKKVLATVALVAVIAGMLGGTAVGKKNYFFRKLMRSEPTIYVDNDKNKKENSQLEEAYTEIKSKLKVPLLKLNYRPTNMIFEKYIIYDESEVELIFSYETNIVRILQMQNNESASANMASDRQEKGSVYNKWINKYVNYSSNISEDNHTEYETVLFEKGGIYYLFGTMPEEEYKMILENLTFY